MGLPLKNRPLQEAHGYIKDDDSSFDVKFWSNVSTEEKWSAAWEVITYYYRQKGNLMNSDFVDLLKLLGKWKVQYVIIGGYAVMEYTEPRATKDLDKLIACSKTNATRIFAALKDFGVSLSKISADFFSKKGCFYKIGRPPNRVDIITSADGATFRRFGDSGI